MFRAAVILLVLFVAGAAYPQRFVSPNGDNSTGISWATAFTSVSAGVTAAQSANTDLWIAAGTYAISSPITVSSNRHLLGGFPATGNPGLIDRDTTLNPTVLDANSTGHIFVCSGATNVLFDGLQFTEAAGGGTDGGAIRAISSSDIDVNDCVFFNNGAQSYGGGVYLDNSHADITRSTFTGNTANEAGALMLFNGTADVSDSTFSGNDGSQGGAILVYQTPINIARCTFNGNTSQRGGAVAVREGNGSSIVNSVFYDNTASDHGGAINLESQLNITIVNNTFVDNTATTRGGGVFYHDSNGFLANCIFVNNNQRAIYENSTAADPTVRNNLFFNNPDGVYFDEATTSIATAAQLDAQVAQASSNFDGDPVFVNEPSNDFHLTSGSVARNNGTALNAPSDDFDGEARDTAPDIGFDEKDPGLPLSAAMIALSAVAIMAIGAVTARRRASV